MTEVEVIIENFKDITTKNFHNVIRDGKEIYLNGKLMQIGDIYKVSRERAKELINLNYVKKVQKVKDGE